jgi:tryptophanase
MRYVAEPFKIKVVEPLKLTTPEYRRERITAAHFNDFALRSDDVYIDLQTDSGTGALSDAQQAGLMLGDESYSGGRSYYRLLEVAREIFGYDYIQPVHQGRAAEKVLFPLIITPGQYVLSNTFFDTTRAHVGLAGGQAVDLLCPEGSDTAAVADFKGNIDLYKLTAFIEEHGAASIAAIVLTITNNSAGGQPVSMENIRAASRIAHEHGLLMVIDAARYAENAYFIKEREPEFAYATTRDIARETFSYADAFTFSAKKDAIVSMGGLMGVRDNPELAERIKSQVISYEGYVTYGGLAGRDLEAMSVGLTEGLNEDYLRYRVGQSRYLAERLDEYGIPYQNPPGGHGVFIDAGALLPHIPWYRFPGHALAVELFIEAGVRATEIGSFMLDPDPRTGEQPRATSEFTRLALPRRVYTQAHLDVVAEAVRAVQKRAESVPGYEIVSQPATLRHFTARLRQVSC